ncbi:hypothetical protein ACFL2Q_08280 [Thermodesulfobacteriota bacterium]
MRKVLVFFAVMLATVAVTTAAFACGCGGDGKLKPEPIHKILGKA